MEKIAKEIETKSQDYCEIVERFSALLSEENEALRAYDIKKVGAMLENKAQVVGAYRSIVGYFIKNQNEMKKLPSERQQQMKELSQKLETLMKENDILLNTKMQTSKTVMDTFVNIAKKASDANSTSYGSGGKYSKIDNTRSAMAINQTL